MRVFRVPLRGSGGMSGHCRPHTSYMQQESNLGMELRRPSLICSNMLLNSSFAKQFAVTMGKLTICSAHTIEASNPTVSIIVAFSFCQGCCVTTRMKERRLFFGCVGIRRKHAQPPTSCSSGLCCGQVPQ